MRRHSSSVAQDFGTAAQHTSHDTGSGRSVGSTVRHGAMLTGATLSHAYNAESE